MTSVSLALCVNAGNDAEGLRRLVENIQGHVDKIVVVVSPDNDEALSTAKDLADEVIVEEQSIESSYEKIFSVAGTDYVMLIHTDETLEHPERLREIAQRSYDAVYFPRRNWISGYLSKCFTQHDPSIRMFRCSDMKHLDEFISTISEDEDANVYRACECWIDRRLTIEEVRERTQKCFRFVGKDSESNGIEWSQQQLAVIEEEYLRRTARGNKIRILLVYMSEAHIGDVLMTIPAVREVRRRYPEAEITYRIQVPEALGKGRRYGEYIYECLHPDIDYIEVVQPGVATIAGGSYDNSDFDLIFDWEYSLRTPEGMCRNGFEVEADWAGFEPSDGNYKPDWIFAKGEEKFGRNWFKQHCKTERCVGLVLTATSTHRTWPLMEDWVNAMLKEYPDVSIMTFGRCRANHARLPSLCRMFGVEPGSMAILDDQKSLYWYDPNRLISCSNIDPEVRINIPAWRQAMGLNLREQAAVYPHLDLLITPDTGPMHIAAALGVPTVVYFSTVSPDLRIKHFPWMTAVTPDFHCSPCGHEALCKYDVESGGAPCLHTITVEKLMEEVRKRLGEGHKPKP